MRISAAVTIGNRSVGMLSLIGIMRRGAYGPLLWAGTRPTGTPGRRCARARCPGREGRSLGQADGLAHGGDPPRLRLVAAQAERPALGEAGLARPAAGDHGRGVGGLVVASAGV